MKFIIFCLILGIANGKKCNYKDEAKNLIEMDFIETGGYYNFKSLKLTFPKLDQIFDCVTHNDDLVQVEVFYKIAQGKFEPIGEDRFFRIIFRFGRLLAKKQVNMFEFWQKKICILKEIFEFSL